MCVPNFAPSGLVCFWMVHNPRHTIGSRNPGVESKKHQQKRWKTWLHFLNKRSYLPLISVLNPGPNPWSALSSEIWNIKHFFSPFNFGFARVTNSDGKCHFTISKRHGSCHIWFSSQTYVARYVVIHSDYTVSVPCTKFVVSTPVSTQPARQHAQTSPSFNHGTRPGTRLIYYTYRPGSKKLFTIRNENSGWRQMLDFDFSWTQNADISIVKKVPFFPENTKIETLFASRAGRGLCLKRYPFTAKFWSVMTSLTVQLAPPGFKYKNM